MRRISAVLLPFALALACAKAETPAADSSAMAMSPAGLTESEVAGTWSGTAKADGGTDTTTMHWTQVCAAGTCNGTLQEMPGVTIVSTYRLEADSTMGVSTPYDDKMFNARVIDNWVARISGTSITGRGWNVLADKPDSVLSRYTFTGTKS
ncbi:MAG: hypothetical protein H7066_22060 [Cytophagaceae bacterium]|nr:hypothetical protein [Gemmatimonadaceae bacterium]